MKKFIYVLTMMFLIIGTISCGTTQKIIPKETATETATTKNNSIFPMTITDSYERRVVIEKEPLKIISLAPNITETIFALERGNQLVGRTDYCDYPDEAAKIESVGSLETPSIEKIVILKPDLVIASTHFSKDVLKKLEELGITTIVLYGEESFDGAYET
ncbi:MAG: helical backbone metal receptor, partial [Desulfosporosinus sp.]